ncbi:MAG: hypothetical protein WBE37_09085 [Bryobacteraceae bacterium]
MQPQENKTSEEIQLTIVGDIEEFRKNNPEIIAAMEVMNMSMTDYLQAMESVRGGQTYSYSAASHIPIQL